MSKYQWKELLTQWSSELLESKWFAENLQYFNQDDYPPEVIKSGWLGYPGATEEQLVKLENYLGTALPPDYREFLHITNGWRETGTSIDKIWSAEEVEWLSVRNQFLIDVYTEDSEPRSEMEEEWSEDMYIASTIEISDWGDSALYLLNPQIVTANGEWEAWFFANWLPGARPYFSFWELMQEEYKDFREMRLS
jgi:hypothetical protein